MKFNLFLKIYTQTIAKMVKQNLDVVISIWRGGVVLLRLRERRVKKVKIFLDVIMVPIDNQILLSEILEWSTGQCTDTSWLSDSLHSIYKFENEVQMKWNHTWPPSCARSTNNYICFIIIFDLQRKCFDHQTEPLTAIEANSHHSYYPKAVLWPRPPALP